MLLPRHARRRHLTMPTTRPATDPRVERYDCGCLSWETVVDLSGGALTYRMLQYWTTGLRLVAAARHSQGGVHLPPDADAGTGSVLGWSPADAPRIAAAAILTRATGIRPEVALRLPTEPLTITTPDGARIRLTLDLRPPPPKDPE